MAAASPFEDYWFAGEGSNFTCLDNRELDPWARHLKDGYD